MYGDIPEARVFETLVATHLNTKASALGLPSGIQNAVVGKLHRAEIDLMYFGRDEVGGLVIVAAEIKNGPTDADSIFAGRDVADQISRQKLALRDEFGVCEIRTLVVCNGTLPPSRTELAVSVGLPIDFSCSRALEPSDLAHVDAAWNYVAGDLLPDPGCQSYKKARTLKRYEWWRDQSKALLEIQLRLSDETVHPEYRERLEAQYLLMLAEHQAFLNNLR